MGPIICHFDNHGPVCIYMRGASIKKMVLNWVFLLNPVCRHFAGMQFVFVFYFLLDMEIQMWCLTQCVVIHIVFNLCWIQKFKLF
jgi:hypothetical protein